VCRHAWPSSVVVVAAAAAAVDAFEAAASSVQVVPPIRATETVTSLMPLSHYGRQNHHCSRTQNVHAAAVDEAAVAADRSLRLGRVFVGIPV